MLRSRLTSVSGPAFILGAIAFITILNGSDAVTIPGSVVSSVLLAVGLSGLQDLYGTHVAALGRNSLRIALIATAVLLCLPLSVMALMDAVELIGAGLWILLFGGPAVMLLGVMLFGVAALQSNPMPRLNWLPAVAGIWYPLAYLFLAGFLFTHQGEFPQQYYPALQGIYLIQFAALCVLGSTLMANAHQEDAMGPVEPSQ